MNNTGIDVVADKAPPEMDVLGATLEVPVFKERYKHNSNGIILGDRCRTRLNENKLGCKSVAEV
jgi:hypothetical protein